MAYAMAIMSVFTVAYAFITYRESSKALRLYADHIKAAMYLPEVQKFVNSHRRVKVDVGEDREGKKVLVRWFVREFDREHPSVTVYVDKETKKPLKTEVKGEK